MMLLFPYDSDLLAAVRPAPQSVADVIQTMQVIDRICIDADGLKWFNGLYLQVTDAVRDRIARGGFTNLAWLADLDVHFAAFYFQALEANLSGQVAPGCWQAMLQCRSQAAVARIQFALAGMNAHINHDLPMALVKTCESSGSYPPHGGQQYADFTALNSTLDSLIESAKKTLHVRLLGDALPPVSQLEDRIAAWSVAAAREAAWTNGEVLWVLRDSPPLLARFQDTLDGITALAGKTLLVPVPLALAATAPDL
jgi:hypothetical protein